MDGILSAIGSFFKKKKDEVPVITPASVANALNQTALTAQGWGSNILNAIGSIKPLPFGPKLSDIPVTANLPPFEPLKIGNIAGFARDVIQTFPREAAAVVPTITEALGKPFEIKPTEGTPIEQLGKQLVFGTEPVKSYQQQARELKGSAEKFLSGIPLPEKAKGPVASGVSFLPVVGAAIDLGTLGLGGKAAGLAVKNADELATVLKRGLKIPATSLDEAVEPIKVGWQAASDLLSKLNVDKKLLAKLTSGEVIEGDKFVLQRSGDELIANIDTAFKDAVPQIKKGVEFVKKAVKKEPAVVLSEAPAVKPAGVSVTQQIANLQKEGMELLEQRTTAAQQAKETRRLFSPSMIEKINQLKSVAKSKAFQEGDIETLRKTRYARLVDDVTEAVREASQQYAGMSDEEALNFALSLPTKESTRVKRVTQLSEAAELEKQLATDTEKFVAESEGIGARNISEAEFNKTMKEAGDYLKQEYPMTPAKHEALIDKKIVANEKAGQKLLKEWTENYGDETIDLSGKGGLKLSGEVIERLPNWKDKNRALLNIATPGRNIEDVAGSDAPKLKEFFFDRVAHDTQNIQNDLKGLRAGVEEAVINKLGIKPGSTDDQLVFRYGEGRMTLDELKAETPERWQQIVGADKYFRNLYDTMLNRINEVITKFGYDPVLRRNDYYTHYQELGNIFDNLGVVFRSNELPAWLSGLTADFRPGKQFFRYAQPRLGNEFTESAIGAIDRYLEPALTQIYRTETVQRGRLLERALRDSLEMRDDIANPTHLSGFTGWLNDYVNTLAGKKSMLARGSEALLGRPVFSAIDFIRKKTSANLVGGNVSSALTNFIPFTQAFATTDKPSFVKGLVNAAISPLVEANNYSIGGVQSMFLRNRFGVEKLAPLFWENIADKATWLFLTIDKFVANTLVGGKYYEGLKQGLGEVEAMVKADKYAAAVMADRSLGQLPQVFQNQGLLALLTQYQVEVNNQLQFMFRDIPKESGSIRQTASTLGQIAVYSYLFNNMFQYLTGRKPAFDPIDIAVSSAEEAASTKAPDEKRRAIVKKIGDNLPFVQVFLQGGRIPIAAGIPSASELANNPLGAVFKFGALYGAPVGGYQAYKTLEGTRAFAKGYEEDTAGRVKYPIDQDLMNLIRGTLFGKYSFPEASAFFKEGLSPLGYDQTIILKNLLAKDPEAARTYYDNLINYREITGDVARMNDLKNQLRVQLADPNATQEDKAKAYADFLATIQGIRSKMVNAAGNQPAGTATVADLASLDQSLIKSALSGLPLPQADVAAQLGSITGLGIGKGKGISLKGIRKPGVKKLSTKPIRFTLPKVKSQKAGTVKLKLPAVPRRRGIPLAGGERSGVASPKKPQVNRLRVV
jgi:hypothetical protein